MKYLDKVEPTLCQTQYWEPRTAKFQIMVQAHKRDKSSKAWKHVCADEDTHECVALATKDYKVGKHDSIQDEPANNEATNANQVQEIPCPTKIL